MANDPKKPKGEPTADQVIQRPGNMNMSDGEIISDALYRQNDRVVTARRGGKEKEYHLKAVPLDQQILEHQSRAGIDSSSAYIAQVLQNYKKNNEKITQKDRSVESGQTRPQQKKKTTAISGNQGIIGSMLNLGGNKLLGGN